MSYNFCIALFFLLCVYRSEQIDICKTLKGRSSNGGSEVEEIEAIANDALNVKEHLDEYIPKLRETLKNEHIPPNIVKYYLFTSSREEPFDVTTLKCFEEQIPYNSEKPIAFVVHGYDTAGVKRDMMVDLIQSVVNLDKYNVFAVDYSEVNNNLLSNVLPKAFLAAKDMARFLQFLMDETGTGSEQIHLIGVSLGGQISGMIGSLLPGLGRITALDPGGSFFHFVPEDLRLDRSDANFVQVIHTNGAYPLPKGWGFYEPCGHLDFYPNGGTVQPGCNLTNLDQIPTTKEEINGALCMHVQAVTYFIEATCGDCTFKGTLCDSYENFKKGLCTPSNSSIAVMGEFATKPPEDLPENSKFFLETNDHYPFCKLQES